MIRREYLDRVLFWNASDLKRKLQEYRNSYNGQRVHASLDGRTPDQISTCPSHIPAQLDRFAWNSHCRGLFHTPVAA
ncbi:MAG: integrase core domain-containing protein [Acidiferrobacterales bacterium]